MTNKDTKTLLIEKGAGIIYIKGFNNTGINDILEAAGVPKGSFYHYFKNKEDFGVQLIDHFLIRFLGGADLQLKKTSTDYISSLKEFFDGFLCFFEENGYQGGCPIANFSLEMSDLNERIRQRLSEAFNQMQQKVLIFLTKAKAEAELPKELNLEATAEFILNSWEGALLRIKVTKNSTPMHLFNGFVFENLLNYLKEK
jgi:TetR/AcrR family transcriptional regulator, transcriptional repressor for nem operon